MTINARLLITELRRNIMDLNHQLYAFRSYNAINIVHDGAFTLTIYCVWS